MQRCYWELFERVPELHGIMITPGEFKFCPCSACSGQKGGEAIFEEMFQDESRLSPRVAMAIDYLKTFHAWMTELGKEPIVRSWGLEPFMGHMPKGIDYATKYSLFDACYAGPDPVLLDWIGAGHTMWTLKAIEAENSGLITWHDERWCKETAGKCNALDTVGTMLHINMQGGFAGHLDTLTSSRNTVCFLEACEPVVDGPASVEAYRRLFGCEDGVRLCRVAELAALWTLNITSVVHLHREGWAYTGLPWLDGAWRWAGVLGNSRMDPPDWANAEGLTVLSELVRQVREAPETCTDVLARMEGTVIHRMDAAADHMQEGLDLVAACAEPGDPEAAREFRMLRAAIHIAYHAGREYAAALRARVAWEAVKGLAPGSEPQAEARRVAVLFLEDSLEHLRVQWGWGSEITRIYPDAVHHVAAPLDGFMRYSQAVRVALREEELRRLRTATGPDWEEALTVDLWDFMPYPQRPAGA